MARAAASNAVVAQSISPAELLALLQQSGTISTQRTGVNRAVLENGMLTCGDDTFVYNPSKPAIPACVVRIVKPPVPYMSYFLAADESNGGFDAGRIGRSDLNGQFSKKYEDPNEQALDSTPANAIFDDIKEQGVKGSYKADIQFQIVPESGEMKGDETIWTLSLSTTSVFEWRGTSAEPEKGLVSEYNTMVELGQLALLNAIQAGADENTQKQAVLNALTSLRLGGVVTEVRILKAQNKDKDRTWSVVHFTPIHIEDMNDQAQIEAGDEEDVPI